jgi:arylsulfatase A-like enzyme
MRHLKLRRRREPLIVMGVFFILSQISWHSPESQSTVKEPGDRRNVILILSDDHRYDFMSFMKKPAFLETPNMDRMAAEGVHFENAFVSSSLCSPSRASILTGNYAHRHGVVDNNRLVPPGTILFPEHLQKAGYETAFIGKWHMGHTNDEPRPGFDHWISYRGQGTYYNPTFNIDGQQVKREGYTADLVTDYALEWLKKPHSKPYFLYLSHKSVHAMFEPAKRHQGKYDSEKLEYPSTMANTEENYADKPRWVRRQRSSWHGVDHMYHGQMDFDTFYRRYTETLLGLDDSIGKVLDYLDASKNAESTTVIYMSDNGFSFGEHGLIDKRHMYEESMRIPMLMYSPGLVQAGTKIKELVQNIDIAPTILDIAGVAAPEEVDGRSFLPLLKGEAITWRDELLYEYYWEWNFPHTPTTLGLRTDRYKYIFYHGLWDTDEFYDLKLDPTESRNLIQSAEHKDLIDSMRSKLFQRLAETEGMVIPLRPPTGWRADESGPQR